MVDLKPCPFCGGDKLETYQGEVSKVWYVECPCGGLMQSIRNREDVEFLWNRRVDDSEQERGA